MIKTNLGHEKKDTVSVFSILARDAWPEFNYKEISDKAKTSNMLLRNSEKWPVFFKKKKSVS